MNFFTNSAVKMYIANSLDESQQVWLSHEITNHPLRFIEFVMSKSGINAFKEYFLAYKRFAAPKPKLLYKDVMEKNE